MSWLWRLAALGCLAGCCLTTRPLPLVSFAAGALVFAALGELTRAPWCWCGHVRAVHEHYTTGTYCSSCRCPKFSAPFTWRRS